VRKAKSCISRRGFIAAGAATSVTTIAAAADDTKTALPGASTGEPVGAGRRKSRIVSLNAKPERIEIDIAETALIVVDMQNDFAANPEFRN
jgi:hypothetical protein